MAHPVSARVGALRVGVDAGGAAALAGFERNARAYAKSLPDEDRLESARAFGLRAVGVWWTELATQHAASAPLRSPIEGFSCARLTQSTIELAEAVGRVVAEMLPESAAHQIGAIYTAMLPSKWRAALGSYYTPPGLVARLIEQATAAGVDWSRCRVLDPACGGGAFLAPVGRRILNELPECSPRILIENLAARLRGYEIDPFAAWLSQVTLDAVLLPITRKIGKRLPVVVTVCDLSP